MKKLILFALLPAQQFFHLKMRFPFLFFKMKIFPANPILHGSFMKPLQASALKDIAREQL